MEHAAATDPNATEAKLLQQRAASARHELEMNSFIVQSVVKQDAAAVAAQKSIFRATQLDATETVNVLERELARVEDRDGPAEQEARTALLELVSRFASATEKKHAHLDTVMPAAITNSLGVHDGESIAPGALLNDGGMSAVQAEFASMAKQFDTAADMRQPGEQRRLQAASAETARLIYEQSAETTQQIGRLTVQYEHAARAGRTPAMEALRATILALQSEAGTYQLLITTELFKSFLNTTAQEDEDNVPCDQDAPAAFTSVNSGSAHTSQGPPSVAK
jgi:hypothetical protein